ncbi:trafficking protein Pga2 [Schizosaccharomyces japonicus yFS275]|uniref:Trafficking protein Pga2 n=1 Tax=Schizosaccharomyces japonicus (strain yFS275 / FY16936) TaxID=402676 RepID=B6JWZ4_SCHJY|nr:trafficking protein Pga2 [Schizosaccharomyces japonicus yFS275]EEB05895.1 trafficking protein Pga2 [Schizosaccharomyces japonicus yFS275]
MFDFAGYLASYTAKDWLRIVIYIGGYMLLRPYLIKWGAKIQEKQHKKSLEQQELEGTIDPEMVHGKETRLHGEFDTDDEEEEENPNAELRWGYSVRRRVREQRKKFLTGENDVHPVFRDDDDDDKDLDDILEKEKK